MQRDEAASSPATVEITEEPKPSISLEELVTDHDAGAAERASAPAAASPDVATAAATAPVSSAVPVLRTARIVALEGRRAKIAFRSSAAEVEAALAPEVNRELLEEAASHKDAVLVEIEGENEPLVVGIVQTRRPREVHVTGEKIVIEGSREVLLRSGRAALRLREDGDVEIVGSRISAASRGLFRLVGRILRLN